MSEVYGLGEPAAGCLKLTAGIRDTQHGRRQAQAVYLNLAVPSVVAAEVTQQSAPRAARMGAQQGPASGPQEGVTHKHQQVLKKGPRRP